MLYKLADAIVVWTRGGPFRRAIGDIIFVIMTAALAWAVWLSYSARGSAAAEAHKAALLTAKAQCGQTQVLVALSLRGKNAAQREVLLTRAKKYVAPINEALTTLGDGKCHLPPIREEP